MALSNNQLLMLDNLIYTDYCDNGDTVGQIIREMKDALNSGKSIEGCMMTNDEWRDIITAIEGEPSMLNYTVQNYENNVTTGMRAACFVDSVDYPTDVNVVFRGTSGDYEWHDNGQGGYLSDTEQQQAAANYVNGLPSEYGDSITVTGHSKGGNKAQYVTIVTDRISRCVSFDGQGFSEEFLEKYGDRIAERSHRIESISASDDYVNCLLYSIAGIKTYVLTEQQDDFLHYHKPNILLDENGNLRPEGAQSELSRFINEYTTYIISNVPEPQRSVTIDGLIALLEEGDNKETIWQTVYGAGTAVSYLDNFAFDRMTKLIFGPKGGVQLTRDFSDESKQKMLGLVSQVESEKWGDFTDWVGDRWYDFESWIGTLNIRHYIDNVNTYHKKVIDKNNTTEKKINEIFAAVRGVDASYGTTLANITRNLAEWKRFVATLSDILEPGRGNFNSQYISTRLNEVLSDISSANVQRIRDTLVQEVSGEPLYDVDLLLEYIKKNPGEMSDDEKQAVLGVIEELQETVAFYESAATIGDEQLGAAFWNRASWVSETNRFESFSAVSAHYNGVYMNVLDGILECGEDSNTFAASILKLSSGESDLSILGLDASADVNKLFGGSSLAAYVAKWKTEHTEQYFAKLEVSEKLDSALLGKTKISVLMNDISDEQSNDTFTGDDIKTGLSFISKINKGIGEYGKNNEVGLSSSILSYLSTLTGIANSKSSSGIDITSDMLSLFKSSVKVEDGIYKYYEKTLHPYEVSKLDAKFGKAMTGLGIASNVTGTVDSFIDTYKAFVDPESSTYDKAAETIKAGGSMFELGGSVYVASQATGKSLQFLSSASGSSKAVNQILQTEQKLKFTTSSAASKNISKANTILALGNVAVSSISGGVKQYGEVTADGEFDMGDAGSVGMNFALSGLDTICNTLTLGLVDFDAENVADDLESDADEFVRGDSWAAQYIRNQDKNVVLRFGVSVGAGAYILGENVVEGVANGAKTVGSWLSTGWNTVTNWF